MGMAASQARYLGLTARKTNCEWEGQQINQARTALANQSANLFNQLLGLKVPDCPDKTDFTKVQYSYSDGDNASVLDNWKQLSNSNKDYNYIVEHYYNANIYTGAKKLMSDPQVTFKNDATASEMITIASNMVTKNDDRSYSYYLQDEAGKKTELRYQDLSQYKYDAELQNAILDSPELKNAILDLVHEGKIDGTPDMFSKKGSYKFTPEVTNQILSQLRGYHDGTSWHFATVDELEKSSQKTLNEGYADLSKYKEIFEAAGYDEDGVLNIGALSDDNLKAIQADLGLPPTIDQLKDGYTDLSSYDLGNLSDDDRISLAKILKDKGVIDKIAELDGWIETNKEAFDAGNKYLNPEGILDSKENSFEAVESLDNVKEWLTAHDKQGQDYYEVASGAVTDIDTAYSVPAFRDMTTTYNPTFVGNQRLTELGALSLQDKTALEQIAKDCPDSTILDYLTLKPDGTIEYGGVGIYKFEWNGDTRYTTYEDLVNSMETPMYTEKPIEYQNKLATFDAFYNKEQVKETNYALLESDGNGRFRTVKFDNDSTTYILNCEEVTDEAAYDDAMNSYYHDVAVYEKTIADINAKTEVIQQQDRTLELRLKQLDTEQLALQTEMEAVKKVISKNVEMTFKTFSGS